MVPVDRTNTAKETALAPILEKFPEAKARLWRLFCHTPSFQSLCEDYRDCLGAWHYWRQATSEDAPAMCQSYAELLQELEQEVRDYLEKEEAPGSTSG